MNIARFEEEDFKDYLKTLLKMEITLEDAEKGVFRQFLDKGWDSLTEKQKKVFMYGIERNSVEKCNRCDEDIPWSEMIEAVDNGGYCSYCSNMMEN